LEILYERHSGRISLALGEVLQEVSRLVEAKVPPQGIFSACRGIGRRKVVKDAHLKVNGKLKLIHSVAVVALALCLSPSLGKAQVFQAKSTFRSPVGYVGIAPGRLHVFDLAARSGYSVRGLPQRRR
jgi:hypothetical protein